MSSKQLPISLAGSLLLAMTTMTACQRGPPALPLTPELAAIQCPADAAEHGSAMFGKAELTFVCIDKKLADTPSLLRCDLESRPMICEDAGTIILRHNATGVVYSGSLPVELQKLDPPGSGSTDDSELIVYFHSWPPRTPTFDAVETNWRFLIADGSDLLPHGFSFVKGTLCDRAATVLQTGVCNLEARTTSLYWNISISVRHKEGTPIPAEEYRTELAFWLKHLGRMVVDPKD